MKILISIVSFVKSLFGGKPNIKVLSDDKSSHVNVTNNHNSNVSIGNNNTIVGANNSSNGHNNVVIGTNRNIKGSNNVIIG